MRILNFIFVFSLCWKFFVVLEPLLRWTCAKEFGMRKNDKHHFVLDVALFPAPCQIKFSLWRSIIPSERNTSESNRNQFFFSIHRMTMEYFLQTINNAKLNSARLQIPLDMFNILYIVFGHEPKKMSKTLKSVET